MALFENKVIEPKVIYVDREKVVTKVVKEEKPNSLISNETGSLKVKKDEVKEENKEQSGFGKTNEESRQGAFGKSNDETNIIKKYEGVDFNKFSKEKLFRVINELLIAVRKYQTGVDKSESENMTFYKKNEESQVEVKRLKDQIEFLARKLSPSFNKYSIENKEQHLTPNQIINLILEDVLKDKKTHLEQIKTLRDEKLKDKELLEELKRQLSEKLSEDFIDSEYSEKSEFKEEEIASTIEKNEDSTKTVSLINKKENKTDFAIIGINLKETRENLTELEHKVIRYIGKTGVSLYPELLKYLVDEGATESKVKTSFVKLEQYKIVSGEIVKTAKIKRGVKVYELTKEVGVLLYKEDTGLNPVPSERSKVIKDHDNLVHGYSVLETAKVLETLGYLDITTNRKDNEISLGKNKFYIPDIIALNPITKQKEYFEVEFGNHNTLSFDEKLTKANMIARILRFVVPSEIIKNNILNKVNHWNAGATAQKSTMKISIATISDLENKTFGLEIKE